MPKQNTNSPEHTLLATNSAFEFVAFSPLNSDNSDLEVNQGFLQEKVLAVQTCRLHPNKENPNSTSPYHGFNLGLHVGDNEEQVFKNRAQLQQILPENAPIQWLNQVHGAEVVNITRVSTNPVTADAAITQERNICLAVMTADCLPILLVSKQGNEVAAIHGGWRPLAANIIANTIDKMDNLASDLYAWLGPCIGSSAFEVGKEVKQAFVEQDALFAQAFSPQKTGKYLADLHKIARLQLSLLGVKEIKATPKCTFTNSEQYYSYRKNSITGRMASLICLR